MTEAQIQASVPLHAHSHSVYDKCPQCLMFGINLPASHSCGNCGFDPTFRYYPACCLLALISSVKNRSVGNLLAKEKTEWWHHVDFIVYYGLGFLCGYLWHK